MSVKSWRTKRSAQCPEGVLRRRQATDGIRKPESVWVQQRSCSLVWRQRPKRHTDCTKQHVCFLKVVKRHWVHATVLFPNSKIRVYFSSTRSMQHMHTHKTVNVFYFEIFIHSVENRLQTTDDNALLLSFWIHVFHRMNWLGQTYTFIIGCIAWSCIFCASKGIRVNQGGNEWQRMRVCSVRLGLHFLL